jgi:hypothetical protein
LINKKKKKKKYMCGSFNLYHIQIKKAHEMILNL